LIAGFRKMIEALKELIIFGYKNCENKKYGIVHAAAELFVPEK